jgi:dihydrofolate reductase
VEADAMGKLVVTEFLSVDGIMEDPGGAEGYEHGGWAFKFERGPEGDRFKFDELMAADAQLLGRITYEGFAKAWPAMDGDEFGKKMNAMPKYVVSSMLESADWNNSTILRGELAEEVGALKQRYDGDILLAGSARLAQGLADADLVDEYRLMIFPIVLGHGKRLFRDGGPSATLSLGEVGPAGDCVTATYRRAPAGA